MIKILLLTKNVLSGEGLVKKLQHLNYEVFCSSSILDEIQINHDISKIINHFSIIIIGETISTYEMSSILLKMKQYSKSILREVDNYPNKDDLDVLMKLGVYEVIQKNDSIELLREQLARVTTKYCIEPTKSITTKDNLPVQETNNILTMPLINLSSLELLVFRILRSRPNEIISRNDICISLWGNASQSRLAQLSSIVKHIKIKLKDSNIDQEIIQTIWGKGYRFYENITIGD